jgi:hypothetical protein
MCLGVGSQCKVADGGFRIREGPAHLNIVCILCDLCLEYLLDFSYHPLQNLGAEPSTQNCTTFLEMNGKTTMFVFVLAIHQSL